MNTPTSPAGLQLDSAALHARQKTLQSQLLPGTIYVAAVGITDPVNIGTIFRISDAVRCERLIFVESVAIDERRITKVSRHTSVSVPHEFLTFDDFLNQRAAYPPLVALEITTTSHNLFTTSLPPSLTLIVGGESKGIPEAILAHCTLAVHIPMFGINSSMNVATSLGIALYEFRRQRGLLRPG